MNNFTEINHRYAGFWIRLAASIIDFIFIALISAFVHSGETSEQPYIPLIILLYYSLFECSKWQATIGKLVLGLKVVDGKGMKISFLRSFGRAILKYFSAILIVGILLIGWTKRKQGLHDLFCRTTVIYKKSFNKDNEFENLSLAQLQELWLKYEKNPRYRKKLEAYLDKHEPDWQTLFDKQQKSDSNTNFSKGPMSVEDAYEILGLKQGAGKEEIRTAHKRLIGKIHPDIGGSNYLAAQINQARDLLLK